MKKGRNSVQSWRSNTWLLTLSFSKPWFACPTEPLLVWGNFSRDRDLLQEGLTLIGLPA